MAEHHSAGSEIPQSHTTEAMDMTQNWSLWRMWSTYGAMHYLVACQKRRRRQCIYAPLLCNVVIWAKDERHRRNYKDCSLSRDANQQHCTMSSASINISNGKGSTSWVQRQSTQTPCHIHMSHTQTPCHIHTCHTLRHRATYTRHTLRHRATYTRVTHSDTVPHTHVSHTQTPCHIHTSHTQTPCHIHMSHTHRHYDKLVA